MKKIILVLILVGGLGAGTYYWKNGSGEKKDEPTTSLARVERGSIQQIVATTGKVVSNLDVDIKCKASGTVDRLPYDISDSVRKDAVICEINKRDMDRVVKQTTVNLDSSKARLANARQTLLIAERTLKTDTERAKTALESAIVAADDARAKADRMKQLFEKSLASQEECDTAETAAIQAKSAATVARIKMEELKTQEEGLEVQRQNVTLAEGQVLADEIALAIANDAYKDCTVLAPMDGVVTDRKIQEGTIIASAVSNVAGGTTILTLSDLSRIFVLASVDESDIGKVRVGQDAVISVDAYPTMQFAGKVVRIASKGLNTQNVVTFEVKIEVLGAIKTTAADPGPEGEQGVAAENEGVRASDPSAASRDREAAVLQPVVRDRKGADSQPLARTADLARGEEGSKGRADAAEGAAEGGMKRRGRGGKSRHEPQGGEIAGELKNLLKPEMTANIEITTADRQNVLTIPVEAVSRLSGRFYANLPDVGETPQKKPIEIGITDGEKYELLGGLNEGDSVVIRRGDADSRWANNAQRRPGPQGGAAAMRMMRAGRGGR